MEGAMALEHDQQRTIGDPILRSKAHTALNGNFHPSWSFRKPLLGKCVDARRVSPIIGDECSSSMH